MTFASKTSLPKSPQYIEVNGVTKCLFDQPFNQSSGIQQDFCLFLDIDGTLAEFTINPKDSVIPKATLLTLQQIQALGIYVAIVTGRSLIEAQAMVAPLQLPIAATHGLEIAFDGAEDKCSTIDITVDNKELIAIKQSVKDACSFYDDFTIEDKPYSVALHYRESPLLADIAYTIMSEVIASYAHWTLKQGKYVWEVVPKGADKGTAILSLLANRQMNDRQSNSGQFNNSICPIFIGDDITDEAGFEAIQTINDIALEQSTLDKTTYNNGMGIKVGHEPTCAHYYVNNIDEVGLLLTQFLVFFQQRNIMLADKSQVFSVSLQTRGQQNT